MNLKNNISLWGERRFLFCSFRFLFRLQIITFTLLGCIFGIGCTTSSSVSEGREQPFSPQDLFPEKSEIRHAKGFSISYFNHYKIVRILSPFEKSTDTASYILLQRGMPKPKGYPGSRVIEIPIRSLVAMSSLHIGLVGFLDAENVLTGLGNIKYVSSPKVIEKIKRGEIFEAGKDQTLDEEKLIIKHPDLVMATGSPVAKMNRFQSLNDAGVPVLINSEWIETTPLGRAEWVKLLAALLNQETLVNEKFARVEKEYKRLSQLAKKIKNKPSILTGMNSKSAWFIPNGNSYMAGFLHDAGGTFHWSNTKSTGSLPLDFEAVYPVALNADYWLNISITDLRTKKDMLARDKRYADFKSFKSGNIYNYNKRMNASGANDYWESGAVNPQQVLADLIKILHPELLPEHELVYYRKVE